MPNTLYYGDNLPILREHIASESVDLIYLDPPFNSNRSYNVLFRLFLTLEKPTRDMLTEAAAAGFYNSPGWGRTYPRIQILWINDLLHGSARPEHPPTNITFKQAAKVQDSTSHQPGLGLEG